MKRCICHLKILINKRKGEFNSVEEIKQDWYSDNCTLPANDDEVIYAEIDGVQLHYPTIFEELLNELGMA